MPSILTDLFGLVVFLGIVPSSARWAWDCELSLPYRHGNTQALESVVGNVLWRTAKKDVLKQVLSISFRLLCKCRAIATIFQQVLVDIQLSVF